MNTRPYSDELYHYGRKGMKWGQNIFGKQKTKKHRKRKNNTHRNVENIKRSLKRGNRVVSRFLRDNKKLLLTSSAILGLSAIGIPYASLAASVIGNVDMSSIVGSRTVVSGRYTGTIKNPNDMNDPGTVIERTYEFEL